MKAVTIQHEEEATTIVAKLKEEMDNVTYCLKETKQNILKMQIDKGKMASQHEYGVCNVVCGRRKWD